MEKLQVLEMGKEVRIDSVKLVEIINEIRKEEDDGVELLHKSFMTKIDKELDIMKKLKISQQNILPSHYINDRGKTYPCYSLNRNGALQMLNSESTVVRFKTVDYIEKLENKVVELKEDNKELYEIGYSEEELEVKQYKLDNTYYALRNVTSIIENSTYATLEQEVAKIIDVHSKIKAKDRYKVDRKLNGTEYKNKVKQYISVRLEEVLSSTRDTLKITVGTQINVDLQKGMLETTNRSTGKLLAHRERDIDKLEKEIKVLSPSLEEMYCVNVHPFSWNYAIENGKRLPAYNNWINNFPESEVPCMEMWEIDYGIDFSKPIKIFLRYVNMKRFDMDNLSKSFIDMLFNEYRGVYEVDDNIIHSKDEKTIEHCNSFADGKVYFYLQNMSDEEIENITY